MLVFLFPKIGPNYPPHPHVFLTPLLFLWLAIQRCSGVCVLILGSILVDNVLCARLASVADLWSLAKNGNKTVLVVLLRMADLYDIIASDSKVLVTVKFRMVLVTSSRIRSWV